MAAPLASTTTLVQASSLLCNQDTPEMVCRISFQGATVADPLTWVDFSSRLRSYQIETGGANELEAIDPGTCTVVLDDRARDLDPFNTSSIYYPNVKPRRRLWMQSYWAGECKDQFYGWTGSFQPSWVQNSDAVVTVEARDGLSPLSIAALPSSDPPADSYAGVVLFDQPIMYLTCDELTGSNEISDAAGGGRSTYSGFSSVNAPIFVQTPLLVGDMLTGVYFDDYHEFRFQGDIGDLQGLATLAADGWIKSTAATPYTGGEWRGAESTTAGPNNLQFYLGYDAATPSHVQARITTTVGKFTATGATTLAAGATYHIGMIYDGTNLKVYLNGVEDGTVAATGKIKARSTTGTVMALTGVAGWAQHFAVYPSLSVARLVEHNRCGRTNGLNARVVSTRIDQLLPLNSSVSFAPRRIRAAGNSMQAIFYGGQNLRGEFDNAVVVAGDPSMFFFAKDGAAVLLDQNHRTVSPWDTVQATFDDDGTDLSYLDVSLDDGASFVRNDVRGQVRKWGIQGALQAATDATSTSAYGPSPKDLGETLHFTDASLATEVSVLLAKYKDPIPRVTSINLSGVHNSGQVATQLFNRELGDKVRVFRRPMGGGSAIDQSSWIRQRTLSQDFQSELWPRGTWALSSRGA